MAQGSLVEVAQAEIAVAKKAGLLELLKPVEKKEAVEEVKMPPKKPVDKEIAGIEFNGMSADPIKSSYHILNVRFPVETDLLIFNLDLKGIAVSGGSACQSGAQKGSHVLGALLAAKERNKASIRFSFSYQNTIAELDYTISVLKSIISA
jgi:cysteine desulfurase